MRRFYIGFVDISPAMEAKLGSKHRVSAEEVRDACQAPNQYDTARWHRHDEYGWRLLVYGRTRTGRSLKIILKPIDQSDGTWRLKTAFEKRR